MQEYLNTKTCQFAFSVIKKLLKYEFKLTGNVCETNLVAPEVPRIVNPRRQRTKSRENGALLAEKVGICMSGKVGWNW